MPYPLKPQLHPTVTQDQDSRPDRKARKMPSKKDWVWPSFRFPTPGAQSPRRRLSGKGAPEQAALEWLDKLLFLAGQLWTLRPVQRPQTAFRSTQPVLTFKP